MSADRSSSPSLAIWAARGNNPVRRPIGCLPSQCIEVILQNCCLAHCLPATSPRAWMKDENRSESWTENATIMVVLREGNSTCEQQQDRMDWEHNSGFPIITHKDARHLQRRDYSQRVISVS